MDVVDPKARREQDPAGRHPGVCVWFTGLCGSGKTTSAVALCDLLAQHGHRAMLLDGDTLRARLAVSLGFSREDRDVIVRLIGTLAAEEMKVGGVVVVASVSPFRDTRAEVRTLVEPGAFVEVFVDTPLEVCETRDPKGLYARARRGEIVGLTGLDHPYEPPLNPELVLDTLAHDVRTNAQAIVEYLCQRGLL